MLRTRRGLTSLVCFVLYVLAAIALTWPLARDFRTRMLGEASYDMRHALWVVWHTAEAFVGHAAWPRTDALYFPRGISVLLDGVGPLNSLFALPFWPLGPEAAYNGAALAGVALSGWCMFLLARHVIGDVRAAFAAGLLFMAWPIHLSGLHGHLEKLFTGFLPLSVLAALIAFDPQRSRWWLCAPGLALLGALLQNANQFVFAMLAVTLVGLIQLARTSPADRRAVVLRATIAGAVAVLVCTPMIALLLAQVRDPLLVVSLGDYAFYYSPDLWHLLLPSPHQAIGGWLFPGREPVGDLVWMTSLAQMRPTAQWYGSGVETAVTIPVTALLLIVAAWRHASTEARWWLLFAAVFTVLCLGPWLRVAGMGREQLGIPLPGVVLRRIPGLDTMRTPGRYMMMASVGFALAAGLGVRALNARWPRRATLVTSAVVVVALVECRPRLWPQSVLPPTPAFYRQLASDTERYGVLDLPHGLLGWNRRSSAYMYFQLTHRKPIGWSYLSRDYRHYPIDGLDAIWSGDTAQASVARARLKTLGYRYVVWHKHGDELFADMRAEASAGRPRGPAAPALSDPFLRAAFHADRPIVDDDQVTVYLVAP
jgi:hypothetical protein